MVTSAYFSELVASQKGGAARGIGSVCSAHPTVLEAAFLQGLRDGMPVLIESTVNQVNQFGGYTGTTPERFRAFVHGIAGALGFPPDRLMLGGDHLGPYPWRSEPAEDAMGKARALVEACVRAGYRKIHLDASMPLGGDATDIRGALPPDIIARREAELAAAAESAWSAAGGRPDAAPVYVIGTEVPTPGGMVSADGGEAGGAGKAGPGVTSVVDLEVTVSSCREAFERLRLSEAWGRVRAVVAQPGVEFGDQEVHAYDRAAAAGLCAAARGLPGMVLEGHSTDYQRADALRRLVEDGVAVLKVGPALTFALRECLFGLENIEREMLAAGAGSPGSPAGPLRADLEPSGLSEALEAAMRAEPAHWKSHYGGDARDQRLARRFSYSDRSRYYWNAPSVRAACDRLMANLTRVPIPLTLLSQFLPLQYAEVREGRLEPAPGQLARESVRLVLEVYSRAASAVQTAPGV